MAKGRKRHWLEDENYIIKSPVRRIHKVKTCKTVKETYSDVLGTTQTGRPMDERGVLTEAVEVREGKTVYVAYGDWVGRMALLVTLLGVLYYSAYRVKRKNHLV